VGYVVKHVQLSGRQGLGWGYTLPSNPLSTLVNKVTTTTNTAADAAAAEAQAKAARVAADVAAAQARAAASAPRPPAFPVAPSAPPFRHPSLPSVPRPPAPNNPFRAKQNPAPTQPGAPSWAAWWGGKASELKSYKTAIKMAGESGMPNSSGCAMILDNYIMGDLSLGAPLYDALMAAFNAATSTYRDAAKIPLNMVTQVQQWLLAGKVTPPDGPTGGATNAPPDGAHDDNSVPGGGFPGETNALPGADPYSTGPATSVIPGVPNLALGVAAVVLAVVLVKRQR
jgi:hypothetical protein